MGEKGSTKENGQKLMGERRQCMGIIQTVYRDAQSRNIARGSLIPLL